MATAAWVGSMTLTPSAAASGARCRAMPAQPMMTTSAPSRSVSSLPTAIILKGALTGEPLGQSELAQVAQMPPDRGLGDGDDAEPFAPGERRQDARLIDAEYGPGGGLAAAGETRIGVARDHEGIDVVAAPDQGSQRAGDAVHVRLAFDAQRSLLEGLADDFGAILEGDRCQGGLEPARDDLVGIGVHHQNAPPIVREHAGILVDIAALLARSRRAADP
jgi:hypothetical protein